MGIANRYKVLIPDSVSIIYSESERIITISGLYDKKSLILKTKLKIVKKVIYVTNNTFQKISNYEKKKIKMFQGTTHSTLKQFVIDVSVKLNNKLKLVGVGYKVFPISLGKYTVLQFKLGYSHSVYFKLDEKMDFFCKKSTMLHIFGNSYQKINQLIAKIRSYKTPDPYKGKGVLYHDETIILKEGKKIS